MELFLTGRVEKAWLGGGDRIKLGSLELRYEVDQPTDMTEMTMIDSDAICSGRSTRKSCRFHLTILISRAWWFFTAPKNLGDSPRSG